MSQPMIRISMLGKFEIQLNGRPVLQGLAQSRKVQLLVQYLLLQYGRPATHGELTATLWGNAGDADMSLRAVMHRFRNMAEKEDPVLKNCILTTRGAYVWNTALPAEVDVVALRGLAQEAAAQADPDAKAALYRRMVDLYGGSLLPDTVGEPWAERHRIQLQNLYKDALLGLVRLHKSRGELEQVVELCDRGLRVEAGDQRLYMEQILALDQLGRGEQSAQLIREAIDRGCLHGDSRARTLNASYNRMQSSEQTLQQDLGQIVDGLQAPRPSGALLCSYQEFCAVCHAELRLRARYDFALFLAAVRLVPPLSRPGAARTAAVMDVLGRILCTTLRNSDVVARYGDMGYVLLLGGLAADGNSPMERVRTAFYQDPGHDGYQLIYRLHTSEQAADPGHEVSPQLLPPREGTGKKGR